MAGGSQGLERLDGPIGAQGGVAAAKNQLLGLHVELDLADAAMAELEVSALGVQPVIDLVDMDLALDRMDVLDGGEVEVAAPDERLEVLDEGAALSQVPGAGSGLDPCRPLPVLADRLIVVEGGRQGHGW